MNFPMNSWKKFSLIPIQPPVIQATENFKLKAKPIRR